jgi:hypothetical protein
LDLEQFTAAAISYGQNVGLEGNRKKLLQKSRVAEKKDS